MSIRTDKISQSPRAEGSPEYRAHSALAQRPSPKTRASHARQSWICTSVQSPRTAARPRQHAHSTQETRRNQRRTAGPMQGGQTCTSAPSPRTAARQLPTSAMQRCPCRQFPQNSCPPDPTLQIRPRPCVEARRPDKCRRSHASAPRSAGSPARRHLRPAVWPPPNSYESHLHAPRSRPRLFQRHPHLR